MGVPIAIAILPNNDHLLHRFSLSDSHTQRNLQDRLLAAENSHRVKKQKKKSRLTQVKLFRSNLMAFYLFLRFWSGPQYMTFWVLLPVSDSVINVNKLVRKCVLFLKAFKCFICFYYMHGKYVYISYSSIRSFSNFFIHFSTQIISGGNYQKKSENFQKLFKNLNTNEKLIIGKAMFIW